jgi:hypothetical protein
MKSIANRLLQAYRPLYLHGLLMDGQYRIPSTDIPVDRAMPASGSASRKRMLLVALAGLRHVTSFHRSPS